MGYPRQAFCVHNTAVNGHKTCARANVRMLASTGKGVPGSDALSTTVTHECYVAVALSFTSLHIYCITIAAYWVAIKLSRARFTLASCKATCTAV